MLQEDASLSVAEIGDRVGLSSTPCWKRIQRLEADGIILRRVALVDQNKIGLGISVFVSVESGDHSDAWLKTFADAVSAMPEVMELYRMAGDVDYMLRVVVADMASYDVFYKKLISAVRAEKRHLAIRDGEDQVGDGAAGTCGERGVAARPSSEMLRHVIARSVGDQAIQFFFCRLDCFASLAMTEASNLLIVFADLGMGAQHAVHRLEHIAHPLLGDRAFDHHHELRLVR